MEYLGEGEQTGFYGKVGDPIKCHPSHHQIAIKAIRFIRRCMRCLINSPNGAMREGFIREYSHIIIAARTKAKYPMLDDWIFIFFARASIAAFQCLSR
jgi:hypothetical protein